MSGDKSCFNCGNEGALFHGYRVCDACISKLRLFNDATIERQQKEYNNDQRKKHFYGEEIDRRLEVLEKDCIKKKLKLLHVKERLKHIA